MRNPSADPLVSAIVSTYCSERFMRGCLEDLAAQSIFDQIEVIVIDSGSPENEAAIVQEFQGRYDNIRHVRTERETVYQAWNRAIGMARAKYLTNANTDDRHAPHALEALVRTLDADPRASVAYGDAAVTIEPGLSWEGSPRIATLAWPEFDARRLFRTNFVGPQPMWRRDLHERYGLFDEQFIAAGDYEFWLRLALSERFVHVTDVLGVYLMSPDSIEHRNRGADRDEAELARSRHWPESWGTRPEPGGVYLRWHWAALAKLAVSGNFKALSILRRSLF